MMTDINYNRDRVRDRKYFWTRNTDTDTNYENERQANKIYFNSPMSKANDAESLQQAGGAVETNTL